MMDKDTAPLVTCTMLSYRRFDLIYDAIDSLLAQDYPNIELILCDDGSENFPDDKLRKYIDSHKGKNIKRVEIYSNEVNLGTVKNYYRALEKANGKYLIGLASDDMFYDSHVMSAVVEEFERTGADTVMCKRISIDRATGTELFCTPDKNEIRLLKKQSPRLLYNRLAESSFVGGAGTYRTIASTMKHKFVDGRYRYMEDYPYMLSMARCGEKMVFLDIISILYSYGTGVSSDNGLLKQGLLKQDYLNVYKYELMPNLKLLKPTTRQHVVFVYNKKLLQEENQVSKTAYIKLIFRHPLGALVHLMVSLKYRLKKKYAAYKIGHKRKQVWKISSDA